jgi:hypothetical protein
VDNKPQICANNSQTGTRVDAMPTPPAHAKPSRRDGLLWAVAAIAGFALYDIWGAWTEVGDKSGFAHGTGWTLTVIVEVYGCCALYAWLASSPGPRSRRFAMWSAAAAFVLSLIGQASSRLTARSAVPPPVVVVFVGTLPVIVLALIAILVELRRRDRADIAEAVAESAAAAELAALRVEMEAQQEALAAAQSELAEAQQQAAESQARIDALTRKLAAAAGAKGRRKPPAKRGSVPPAAKVPRNVDVQAEALAILTAEPDITGEELGARVGRGDRWGQTFKKNHAHAVVGPDEAQT